MTNNRIKEAEAYDKSHEMYPQSTGMGYSDLINGYRREGYEEGYLAACEKCEGERDEFAIAAMQWYNVKCFGGPAVDGFIEKQFNQFKTHNNE